MKTGANVAIKILIQEEVAKYGKHRHVFREKDLLFEMDNQFIIKLICTKMDKHNLYFIFELCQNGDMRSLINQRSKFYCFTDQYL